MDSFEPFGVDSCHIYWFAFAQVFSLEKEDMFVAVAMRKRAQLSADYLYPPLADMVGPCRIDLFILDRILNADMTTCTEKVALERSTCLYMAAIQRPRFSCSLITNVRGSQKPLSYRIPLFIFSLAPDN